jgi:hypothetical protein
VRCAMISLSSNAQNILATASENFLDNLILRE